MVSMWGAPRLKKEEIDRLSLRELKSALAIGLRAASTNTLQSDIWTVRACPNGGCAAGFMSNDGKRPATYTLLSSPRKNQTKTQCNIGGYRNRQYSAKFKLRRYAKTQNWRYPLDREAGEKRLGKLVFSAIASETWSFRLRNIMVSGACYAVTVASTFRDSSQGHEAAD